MLKNTSISSCDESLKLLPWQKRNQCDSLRDCGIQFLSDLDTQERGVTFVKNDVEKTSNQIGWYLDESFAPFAPGNCSESYSALLNYSYSIHSISLSERPDNGRSLAFISSAKSRASGLPDGLRIAPRASLAFNSFANACLFSLLILTAAAAAGDEGWSTLTARLLATEALQIVIRKKERNN